MQAPISTRAVTRALYVLCVAVILTLSPHAMGAPSDIALALSGDAPQVQIAGETLWSTPFLRALHAGPDQAPRWTRKQLDVLRAAVAESFSDGLDPHDFLDDKLASIDSLPPAARELIATEALARLAFTLRFGKCNPEALDPDWNYSRSFGKTDPTAWLRDSIASDKLAERLAALRPSDNYYRALKKALADLRARQERGEQWPSVKSGPTLKPDMRDARIVEVRARLAASGDYVAAVAPPQDAVYDAGLVEAVRAFQRRNGLDVDGAIGRGTLAVMNVSLAARINDLRVNLERVRWVFRDLEPEALSVNIAAFEAMYLDHGEVRWSGRVIVGKPFRKTPIFKDHLSYVELNPSWTVPPTILKEDILPKLRHDPGYLATKKLRLIDFDGKPVDATTIDWRKRGAGFPWILRQEAGPENPLGRVAFMFPNVHSVYLHDTPTRGLFQLAERAFSSGCIRIEDPLKLAQEVLRDDPRWNRAAIDKAVAKGANLRINLPRKVSIMLLYLTAFPAADGTVEFRRDVYGRDPAVLAALDAPLRWTPPKDYRMPGARGV
ncbi:MAG: L,D-transpeptidase family protein [Proteobacteria bacterium]|nr:L,D-transpeptidase family protein [Pseudomonadota bacterium]